MWYCIECWFWGYKKVILPYNFYCRDCKARREKTNV